MPRFRVPRMQTNAAWTSPAITLTAGSPPAAVDPGMWTLGGAAQGTAARLDLARRLSVVSGGIVIALTAADCSALGAGRVNIEVMRLAPVPAPRPLLRFAIENHPGV